MFVVFKVLPQLTIGSGHDLTLEFDWRDGKYHQNYTDSLIKSDWENVTGTISSTENIFQNLTTTF